MSVLPDLMAPAQRQGSGILHALYSPIEGLFDMLGLGRGKFAPVGRFVFGAATTGIVLYLVKPSFFFNGDQPKTWNETRFPWWMAMVAGGLLTGLFI